MIEAPHQRGNVGDLHRRRRLIVAGGNDAVGDVELDESRRNLAHDLVAMTDNDDLVAARHRAGNDVGEQNGFTRAGRRLEKNAPNAAAEAIGNAALLIWAQQLHDAPAAQSVIADAQRSRWCAPDRQLFNAIKKNLWRGRGLGYENIVAR